MTGALDADMQALTSDLAETFGKAVTLVRTVSEYDPSTGGTTSMDYEVDATATQPSDFTTSRIQDTLIQQSDTVVDVPAKGLDMTSTGTSGSASPQTSDKIKFDGVTWQLIQVGPVYGGEAVALWRLHARK